MNQRTAQVCLFGASPGTGNQGVNALCWSTLTGLAQRGCGQVHVFGYGNGTRSGAVPGGHPEVRYTLHGISAGKRVWQRRHLWRASLAARAGVRRNVLLRPIAASDAVLDASGGDSFTDLYGPSRFRAITVPKQLALGLGRPLILLPQTYGPFSTTRTRRIARGLVGGATLAYARDPGSYARLQSLLGSAFDPARHREGVDLAFGLAPRAPQLDPAVAQALAERGGRPLIGLNVSGLIANRASTAGARFELACDYRELLQRLLMGLLDDTDAHILLIPHVHAPNGHYEADLDASKALVENLPGRYRSAMSARITTVARPHDAGELKWLIAQTDWFCGTRMHATIAALSSGVPAAALAYSLKTRGVFESCGVGNAVVDLRTTRTEEAVERLFWLWRRRDRFARTLGKTLPVVRDRARTQLDDIVRCVGSQQQGHGQLC